MGDSQLSMFRPEFNGSVRIEARRERVTADAGALLLREFMDRSGLTMLLGQHLVDPRDPTLVRHSHVELLRTMLLMRAQGWADQGDVDYVREDPVFRLAVSERRGAQVLERHPALCSQPTLSRLLHALAAPENRVALGRVLLEYAARRKQRLHGPGRLPEVTLDVDSLPHEVHGRQEGSAFNRHYGVQCFHPLVVSWDQGDFLGARLRPGNVHTADGALDFILPYVEWAQTQAERVWLRVDAGFPEPTLLDMLEAVDCRYVARLKSNAALNRLAEPFLKRPVGRPPAEGRVWLHELSYQAGSWSHPRRIVLVVLERPGELFLDYFFLLTNAAVEEVCAEELLVRYRQRGLAEKDFGDWKSALDPRLSSSPRPKRHYRGRPLLPAEQTTDSFAANEATLLLSLLAANLLDQAAALLEEEGRRRLSRARFRQLLLKAAARVTLGKRAITVIVDVSRSRLWQAFTMALGKLPLARGSPDAITLPAEA
jgi:hypothetical protein